MADPIQVACAPCSQRTGRTVVALETGRFAADQSTAQQYNVPVGVTGVRLLCPLCSKQSLFWPTVLHYECENCGHKKEDYIRGGAGDVAPGQGFSYKETFSSGAESKSILDDLRRGAIGGWGSGG